VGVCTLNVKRSVLLLLKYYIGDIIQDNKMGRECGTYRNRRGACRDFVWKPEEKRQLGRTSSKCEDNIKMHLKEITLVDLEWIDLAQDMDKCRALVKVVMTIRDL
jgi:hypothetical protein